MFVLIDLGGIQRVWRIVTGPNPALSPLVWDMCVISIYLVINVVYLALMYKRHGVDQPAPHLASCRASRCRWPSSCTA